MKDNKELIDAKMHTKASRNCSRGIMFCAFATKSDTTYLGCSNAIEMGNEFASMLENDYRELSITLTIFSLMKLYDLK